MDEEDEIETVSDAINELLSWRSVFKQLATKTSLEENISLIANQGHNFLQALDVLEEELGQHYDEEEG